MGLETGYKTEEDENTKQETGGTMDLHGSGWGSALVLWQAPVLVELDTTTKVTKIEEQNYLIKIIVCH